MTQQEFESLQTGDVVDYDGWEYVVMSNNGGSVNAALRASDTFRLKDLSKLTLISRVITRVDVKGEV